eukprot:416686_1
MIVCLITISSMVLYSVLIVCSFMYPIIITQELSRIFFTFLLIAQCKACFNVHKRVHIYAFGLMYLIGAILMIYSMVIRFTFNALFPVDFCSNASSHVHVTPEWMYFSIGIIIYSIWNFTISIIFTIRLLSLIRYGNKHSNLSLVQKTKTALYSNMFMANLSIFFAISSIFTTRLFVVNITTESSMILITLFFTAKHNRLQKRVFKRGFMRVVDKLTGLKFQFGEPKVPEKTVTGEFTTQTNYSDSTTHHNIPQLKTNNLSNLTKFADTSFIPITLITHHNICETYAIESNLTESQNKHIIQNHLSPLQQKLLDIIYYPTDSEKTRKSAGNSSNSSPKHNNQQKYSSNANICSSTSNQQNVGGASGNGKDDSDEEKKNRDKEHDDIVSSGNEQKKQKKKKKNNQKQDDENASGQKQSDSSLNANAVTFTPEKSLSTIMETTTFPPVNPLPFSVSNTYSYQSSNESKTEFKENIDIPSNADYQKLKIDQWSLAVDKISVDDCQNNAGDIQTDHRYSVNKLKNKPQKQNLFNGQYDPIRCCRAKGNIKISKKFTEVIIPNRIKQMKGVGKIYDYMDKTTAFQFYIDENNEYKIGQNKVLYYDFCDMNTNEPLYCVITKISKKENQNYEWKMISKLFTADEIDNIPDIVIQKLPILPTTNQNFIQQLKQCKIINEMLNSKTIINKLIHKTPWHKLKIFNKIANVERLELLLSKKRFQNKLFGIFEQTENNHELIPIILFDNQNQYWIEHLQIVSIQIDRLGAVNIGISYKYNQEMDSIEVMRIHVDKNNILAQHRLVSPHHECHCLDQFVTNIASLKIGNPNDEMNQLRQKAERIKNLRQKMDSLNRKLIM